VQILCTQEGNKKKLLCKGRIKKILQGKKQICSHYKGYQPIYPLKNITIKKT
jgi:hypothetical protein